MYKLILLLFCFSLSLNGLIAQEANNLEEEIFFESGSAELTNKAVSQLNMLVTNIKEMGGDYQLALSAYTDSRGTHLYNKKLAIARAKTISEYLENKAISTDKMAVSSYGEQLAGNDKNSPQKLQKNRRVNILVHRWFWDDLASMQDSLRQPYTQNFTISAAENQLIKGKKGGRFLIEANSFVDAKGNLITSPIDIVLIECYSLGDMINLNLNTTAQDEILESGGMFKLTASNNKQTVFLKKDANIIVSVPNEGFQAGMSVFYGENHSEDNSQMDWNNTQSPVTSALPQLRIAKAPRRPSRALYRSSQLLKVNPKNIDELAGLIKPKQPGISKPYRPKKPNYDKIVYSPKGLEKIFMSKAERQKRTEVKRAKRQLKYEEKLVTYQERKPKYDASMKVYNKKLAYYTEQRAAIIDEHGTIRVNSPVHEKIQALADALYKKALIQYPKDSTAYAKYREQKVAAYEAKMEGLTEVDLSTVNRYFMTINQLGWANIDRFLKSMPSTPLAARNIDAAQENNAMVYLLVPSRNIILRMRYNSTKGFHIPRIPIGEKATIFAIKVDNKEAFVANHEVTVKKNMVIDLDYQPKRLKDIREALAAL